MSEAKPLVRSRGVRAVPNTYYLHAGIEIDLHQ